MAAPMKYTPEDLIRNERPPQSPAMNSQILEFVSR